MVTELPLQILPWEDAYPLHVHILGMVGLPKKKTQITAEPINSQASENLIQRKLWIIFFKILKQPFFWGGAV